MFFKKFAYLGAQWPAFIALFVSIIFTAFQIFVSESPHKYEYVGMYLTLSITLVSIQILAIQTEKKIDKLEDEYLDIIVYENASDALSYCIKSMHSAVRVINTVLINGERFIEKNDIMYNEWCDAKLNFLQKNDGDLKELISSHFDKNQKPRKFVEENHCQYKNYKYKFIDDKVYFIYQFTIFEFVDKKEIVFGWQLSDGEDRKCFRTRNVDIVALYEELFWQYYENSDKSQIYPSVIIQTIKDKCYNAMRPGVWLYLLYNHPDQDLNKVYGVIKITDTKDTNIKNRYKANADVWYYGGRERGKWYSINFEYVPLTQELHIQYDINIKNPSDWELSINMKEYTGYLHFEIYEDIYKTLIGHFKDIAHNEKNGNIGIRACRNNDNTGILTSIEECDLRDAFLRIFHVDIADDKMFNTEKNIMSLN